ncbi:phage antirepressor KilAC domain-containing protein [Fructilactobacillus frigidiflavus]|uniref:phage antirepressor KilAC domain-containing protein n=1 Tax=Fructilactobacillus frigidiflavus TaxID=3242688 RepID=UPI003758020E
MRKKFKRWVTSEVLPSLRNNGVYMTKNAAVDFMKDPRKLAEMLTEFADTKDKLKVTEQENETMKPKALFADAVAISKGTILIRELAILLKQNGLNIGEKRLFERLRNDGYLVKRHGSSFNKPTQRAMDRGLFKVTESMFTHNSGKPGIGLTPRVTGKGQRYFVDKYCPRNMELKEVSNG